MFSPLHLNLCYTWLSPIQLMSLSNCPLILPFGTYPLYLPDIHLNIQIWLFIVKHFALYGNVGLNVLSFKLNRICWQETPEVTIHFNHPAKIQWDTYKSISTFASILDPRYLMDVFCGISWSSVYEKFFFLLCEQNEISYYLALDLHILEPVDENPIPWCIQKYITSFTLSIISFHFFMEKCSWRSFPSWWKQFSFSQISCKPTRKSVRKAHYFSRTLFLTI